MATPARSSELGGSAPTAPPSLATNEKDSDEDRSSGVGHTSEVARRIACDVCRDRKVRCDRSQPRCGRCRRLGHVCRYTASKKQAASKLEISEILWTLNARLAQAEAQLALTRPTAGLGQNMGMWPGSNTEMRFDLNPSISDSQVSTYSAPPPNMEPPGPLDFDDPLLQEALADWQQFAMDGELDSHISHMEPMKQGNHTELLDQPLSEMSPSWPPDVPNSDGGLPPTILFALHQNFFDWMDYVLPIIRRDRFFAAVDASSLSPQTNSLSYAIAMLGASLSSDYAHLQEECYHRSRRYLEMTERHEDEANFLSIEALQACVLITWYEFKGRSFCRAWMSLGRAIRLGKMLGLHRMDEDGPVTCDSGFQLPLPVTNVQAELEERRRTFWVLFIYDAYASARTGSPMVVKAAEISTALPHAEFPTEASRLASMPSLKNVTAPFPTGLLSPFAGMVLMVSLYGRCRQHCQASHEQDMSGDLSYSFWLHHYELDREIAHYSTKLFGHLNAQARPDDPLGLALSMNMCAITISLHEVAMTKAKKGNLPATLITEGQNRCMAAAMEIVEIVQLSHQLKPSQAMIFRQMNTFIMWSLAMATRVLSDHVETAKDDVKDTMALLQLLRFTMEDLKDPSGHWNGLIRDIASQLDRMSHGGKKRKR